MQLKSKKPIQTTRGCCLLEFDELAFSDVIGNLMEFAYPWMARSVIPKLLIVANNHCTSLEFYDREYETPINGIQVHTWCLCNPKLLTKNEKLFLQWVASDMIHVGI